MGEKKEYRSAVRSRRLIRTAFLELLREKPFEKITVTDIVKRADINRSTFYAHYPDVRGMVDELLEEIVSSSLELAKNLRFEELFDDPTPFLAGLTSIGQENLELYKLLGNSDFALKQVENLKAVLVDRAVTSLDIPETIRESTVFQIQINFFIGGILNTYQQWLQGKLVCSTEDIQEQVGRLILSNADIYRSMTGN